jgi:hypothetical protein
MTTVADLIQMLGEFDPELPVGTLIADRGSEDARSRFVRFELLGVAHTSVGRDRRTGAARAAWIVANALQAPGNDTAVLSDHYPATWMVQRRPCGCVLRFPVNPIRPVALNSIVCEHDRSEEATRQV